MWYIENVAARCIIGVQQDVQKITRKANVYRNIIKYDISLDFSDKVLYY